ncbi:MAG: NUDIX domain-containing protein [Anaerolineae bacterium]
MFEALSDLPVEHRLRRRLYPLPSVLALIREAGGDDPTSEQRYLLIKRQKPPYLGKWALVGGKWDFGETLITAVTREVREETGLETRFEGVRGVVSERVVPAGEGEKGSHFLLFVCQVAVVSGQACEQGEGPLGWFSLEEMEGLEDRQEMILTDYALVRALGHGQGRPPYLEVDVIAGQVVDQQVIQRFEEIRRAK